MNAADDDDVLDVATPTPIETGEVEIEPTSADELSIESLDNDLLGVVANDDGDSANVLVTDAFDNPMVDSDGNTVDVDAELTGAAEESDTSVIGDISGEESFDIFDISGVDEETNTGDVTLNVSAEDGGTGDVVFATTELTFVHEAYGLNDGFQRLSLAQPALVEEQETDDITTWNTSAENYDDITDFYGETNDADELLHSGLYVEGSNDDARIGFDFVEDDSTVTAGSESLEEGWNFVSTNFDVSNDENEDILIADDLETVEGIDDDANTQNIVRTGSLSSTLNAEETDTIDDLDDGPVTTASNDFTGNELGTYWVYIDSTDDFDGTRALSGASYDPGERYTAITA